MKRAVAPSWNLGPVLRRRTGLDLAVEEASDACLGTAGPPGTTARDAGDARVESTDVHPVTIPARRRRGQPMPPKRNLECRGRNLRVQAAQLHGVGDTL